MSILYRTCLRNTIVDALSQRPGFRETDSDTDWDFCWADISFMREHYAGTHLLEQQRINHFPNHYELTRKDLLVKNLKRTRRNLVRAGQVDEARRYGFFPATFVLPGEAAVHG